MATNNAQFGLRLAIELGQSVQSSDCGTQHLIQVSSSTEQSTVASLQHCCHARTDCEPLLHTKHSELAKPAQLFTVTSGAHLACGGKRSPATTVPADDACLRVRVAAA